MKETRRVFSVSGSESVVRTVLENLVGFKAVTVLFSGEAALDSLSKVFRNNKSIVCTADAPFLPRFFPSSLDVIEIFATDSSRTIFGADNIININDNIIRQFIEIAERYNVDIGDHVSNSADASAKNSVKSDCLFCRLLEGNPLHEQASLYESDNFLVIPGSGAFLDGYIMILPKAHVMSCAELNDNQRLEMLEVIEDVKFILKSIYHMDILVWENGSGSGGKGKPSTSIVHAHIHACPSQFNVLETTYAKGIPVHPISFEDLPKYEENSYLLIMDYDGSWHISNDINLYIPRQYVRQLIALEHNINGDLWNWREFPFWDNVAKTGNSFIDFVKINYEMLSPRIQKATQKFIKCK